MNQAPQTIHEEAPRVDVHDIARSLITQGFLPECFSIDAHDARPVWDFFGLCALLNQRPEQLVEILQSNGPVYSSTAGIPSSWRALIEP